MLSDNVLVRDVMSKICPLGKPCARVRGGREVLLDVGGMWVLKVGLLFAPGTQKQPLTAVATATVGLLLVLGHRLLRDRGTILVLLLSWYPGLGLVSWGLPTSGYATGSRNEPSSIAFWQVTATI